MTTLLNVRHTSLSPILGLHDVYPCYNEEGGQRGWVHGRIVAVRNEVVRLKGERFLLCALDGVFSETRELAVL